VHIFIDESGQFIPLDGKRSKAAAVVAIVVPSAGRTRLFWEFRRLKRALGARGGELKGAALHEDAVREVLRLLRRHDVIAEAVVIDVGAQHEQGVTEFRLRQAEKLIEHITREHQPTLIQDVLANQDAMRDLANQLFIQAYCYWELVPRLVETATLFWVQRRPQELSSFVWRVDAKGDRITSMERLWTTLIGPMVTARDVPMIMLQGADYSFFSRFDTRAPDGLDIPERIVTDLKKVLREDFAFASSERDLGLQLADIVAATLTRALNGTLQPGGWGDLGPLFVGRREQTIRLIALNEADTEPHSVPVTDTHWSRTLISLQDAARGMLLSGMAGNAGGA
jgi:hypothetical protein